MNFRPYATLSVAVIVAALYGCGGSSDDDSGSGHVRLINASTEYAALDLYSTDTLVSENTAEFSVSDYITLGSGSYTFKLKRADSSTTALSTDRSVSGDVYNTLVAYSTANSLRTVYMTDSEAAPSAGTAKLRIFNTSYEAGSVDIYVTTVGGNLDDLPAMASAIGAEHFSGFSEIGQGSYRIVVTAAGDKTDVRLDIPSITLTDQQVGTLILTSTPGGVLEHGLLLNQRGDALPEKNSSARVRLVAGTTASGIVSASINGANLSTGLKSPTVGTYVMVPAGPITADIKVNGVAAAASGLTATSGADLTLMVLGAPEAPQVSLMSDDNRLPTTVTNAKLRLVHGLNNLNGSVTLTADYSAVATDVAFGLASTPASVPASTAYRLEVTSPVSSAELYLATDVSLQASRVYTVFMLGDATSPLGILRRDR